MIDPVAAVGIAVGVVGYMFAQMSGKLAAFIASSVLALSGLIVAIIATNGSVRYWLVGLAGIVAAYFIRRLFTMRPSIRREAT